jgi:hypothetical protein
MTASIYSTLEGDIERRTYPHIPRNTMLARTHHGRRDTAREAGDALNPSGGDEDSHETVEDTCDLHGRHEGGLRSMHADVLDWRERRVRKFNESREGFMP